MNGERELTSRFYPTAIRLPIWSRGISLGSALKNLSIGDVTVRRISTVFDIEKGLSRSLLFPRFPPGLNPLDLDERIREEVPTDGVEIVEWMQLAMAENVVLDARCMEYNRLGSQLVSQSGDGYCPGVKTEDCRVKGDRGSTVSRQGYTTTNTPLGSFRLPKNKKGTGVFKDLLSYASMFYCASVQTGISLLKWRSLAETPIRDTVGFYRDRLGNSAPNFFTQITARPSLTATIRQRFSSNDSQTLTMNFRDPTNYARSLGTKKVDIAEGSSEVTYTLSAFPYVPPTVAEISPEDNKDTKLESYVVS